MIDQSDELSLNGSIKKKQIQYKAQIFCSIFFYKLLELVEENLL